MPSLTLLIPCAAQGHTQWVPALHTCNISKTEEFKWSILVNFVEDFVLLVVMIFGVLHKRNSTHLWNILYFQALFWILAATLTELPSVVCPLYRSQFRIDSAYLFSQALSFKNINGESIPGAPEIMLIIAPSIDPWNMVSGTHSRFLLPIANTTFL
jgi:hypothetical protein